jgi:uncharacterized membrane protein (TIGR02234 family)
VSRFRPTSKLFVVVLALVGAGILLVSGSRVWVTGTMDAGLGASRTQGTGAQVASGVVALALVAAAAAVASTTAGAVVRRVTLAILGAAALGELVIVGRVLLDPAGALGAEAARSLGRTGTVETHASLTVWPWLCLLAAVLLVVADACGWAGARRWQGLGARYESPGSTAGPRGQRVPSAWERLDAGDDPTTGDPPSPDPT